MKKVLVSGGFDPIHIGHLRLFNKAKSLGGHLTVILNNDEFLLRKKGFIFMPFEERKSVLENLKEVDEVIDFDDDELGSATQALVKIKNMYPESEINFCNGGDRGKDNIPEMKVDGVNFIFSVGGDDKKNSSSWILKNWQYDGEERIWGNFYNLFESEGIKVKELIVKPGKGMSLQKHFKRSEIWLVSEGKCIVNYSKESPESTKEVKLSKFDQLTVELGDWHQITNPFEDTCKIIEIQYGEETEEDDIERYSYYKD